MENEISYEDETKVFLAGKRIGTIKFKKGFYQYFPKGQKEGGDKFKTIAVCKLSLESD